MTRHLMFSGVIFLIMAVAVDAQTSEQLARIVGPFTSPRIQKISDGDLSVINVRQSTGGNSGLRFRVKNRSKGNAMSGFAGICIENSSSTVPFTNFAYAKGEFSASHAMMVDIKMEKPRYEDGTIWLDRGKKLSTGVNRLRWNFSEKEDTSPDGNTLEKVKRLCVFVLADQFPGGAREVDLEVRPFGFGRP